MKNVGTTQISLVRITNQSNVACGDEIDRDYHPSSLSPMADYLAGRQH